MDPGAEPNITAHVSGESGTRHRIAAALRLIPAVLSRSAIATCTAVVLNETAVRMGFLLTSTGLQAPQSADPWMIASATAPLAVSIAQNVIAA
jgi:hypothetical protein